ncbi:N-acetylneuraminate synthase [Marinobacter sp.]|jgi:N,N'-diacetyllegionaminate synthase|uniref:N-acetylneuraminate synthase n=1 Tax=Marinobacter sp. TaxID=50741 RepID=UPI000C646C24|nr:N-acetylneuraminate synthase [Marinobacter sp.]MAB50716.1 N-acetylneuraminate synthase [Marinobacter sp.]MBN15326.1 N-acetylneuraminate synthase [Pelagibacterium sp.]|tara:strand:+ start:892 stop:1896 length:1005 start_codon:yes stop_codon:yes gene_type:complete
MKTLVIAEAGVNHNGDVALAKQLVAVAADAGADFVKFQTFIAENIVSQSAPKADYQKGTTDPAESQQEMIRKLELTREDHLELIGECRKLGIGFFSTAFDRDSINLLETLGALDFVKIPSGELTNLPYLRYLTRHGKPVLLSTGMATLGEVEAAIEVIEKVGTSREQITVLHCTTEYPTPMDEVNLNAMVNMGKAFGVSVGYSDHTPGIEVPIAAVALGATVIEKHFTLDRSLPGPDHRASLEPEELKAMVSAIRNIEKAMGDAVKRPGPSELKNKPIARKSLVAACPIQAGEPFTEANLMAKRPGTGISPMRWDEVIGRKAPRDFAPDELIEL